MVLAANRAGEPGVASEDRPARWGRGNHQPARTSSGCLRKGPAPRTTGGSCNGTRGPSVGALPPPYINAYSWASLGIGIPKYTHVCLPLRLRGLDRLQEGHSLSICLRIALRRIVPHVVCLRWSVAGDTLAIAISIARWIGPLTDGDGIDDDSGLISPERTVSRKIPLCPHYLRSRPRTVLPQPGAYVPRPRKASEGYDGFLAQRSATEWTNSSREITSRGR